jgi:glutaredoxin
MQRNAAAKADAVAAEATAADQEVARKLKEKLEAQKVVGPSKNEGGPGEKGAEEAAAGQPPILEVADGGEKTVPSRKIKGGEKWDINSGKEAPVDAKEQNEQKSDEEKDTEVELNAILKRSPSMFTITPLLCHLSHPPFPPPPKAPFPSPANGGLVIIFSKSYCPYSQKAKALLLKTLSIVPAPFVVELDQHAIGAALQASLAKTTGRRTVPNVLINGKSIGGSDDIQKLFDDGELLGKIKSMGGKRIMEARLT